jgi:hypothetical protein
VKPKKLPEFDREAFDAELAKPLEKPRLRTTEEIEWRRAVGLPA